MEHPEQNQQLFNLLKQLEPAFATVFTTFSAASFTACSTGSTTRAAYAE